MQGVKVGDKEKIKLNSAVLKLNQRAATYLGEDPAMKRAHKTLDRTDAWSSE